LVGKANQLWRWSLAIPGVHGYA